MHSILFSSKEDQNIVRLWSNFIYNKINKNANSIREHQFLDRAKQGSVITAVEGYLPTNSVI